jgi:hypothetical protein
MAQSQYDPLVLLSAYIIKSKLLMKKVTQGTGAKGWDEAMEGKQDNQLVALLRDLNELSVPDYVKPGS